jgi:hypothetical protein
MSFEPHKLELRKQGLALSRGQPQKDFVVDAISVYIR